MNQPAIATFHTFAETSELPLKEQVTFVYQLLLFSSLNCIFYLGYEKDEDEDTESWEWFIEQIKRATIQSIQAGAFHESDITEEAVAKALEHYKIDLSEIMESMF